MLKAGVEDGGLYILEALRVSCRVPQQAVPGTVAWALAVVLVCVGPGPGLAGCPAACRCSFAMLQCLEADGIASVPALAPQESENVTEM